MNTAGIVGMLALGGVLIVIGRPRRGGPRIAELLGQPGEPVRAPATERSGRPFHVMRRAMAGPLGAPLRSAAMGGVGRGLERELMLAGLSGRIDVAELIGLQTLGAVIGLWLVGPTVAVGLAHGTVLVGLAGCLVLVGGLTPRVVLRRRGVRRQRQLDALVSDALDLLTLCVEAGLGFDAALAAVSESIPAPLGAELERTVAEMRLGLSRAESLDNLRHRTDSRALTAFVVALLQADTLGTPVGRVLAGQAAEARIRRRQAARERAGQLPVRILIPTVLLIFPPTFVILLGPAMASIRGAL
jgi:tight adherence protein C